jgi:pimeloyl-ACP methyl ester carboxylesterase
MKMRPTVKDDRRGRARTGDRVPALASVGSDLWGRVEHRFADSAGVTIHYAALGDGPLIVMIHGFPDFWYTWRRQMEALSRRYRTVAVDQRGYNLSGRPAGVDAYAIPLLVDDIGAVIAAEGRTSAVIVGHDWGGLVAWYLGMRRPEWARALIILNLPHPSGIQRELDNNPQQRKNSEYAYELVKAGAERNLTPESLAAFIGADADPEKAHYIEAFKRSDVAAMLNYYRANFPGPAQHEPGTGLPPVSKVAVPVLEFHGLADESLVSSALSGTWDHLEKDFTLVTIPGAGHRVHAQAPDLITLTMSDWLRQRIHGP